MKYTKEIKLLLFLSLGLWFGQAHSQPANWIEVNGQSLFLNGGNVAWVHFAKDIGPGKTDLDTFDEIFEQVHKNGGNAMRLWLHTNGENTPEWQGSKVVGPGKGAIEDLRGILDRAAKHDVKLMLCLWSFDMLRKRNGEKYTDRAYDLLTDSALTQSYIDNALVPMVDKLKGHPGILAWEIFNEPEGMSEEFGWDFNRHVPMADIQRFINMTAGAIHRRSPDAKVTNGAWSFHSLYKSTSDKHSDNYYTDQALISAGGDSLGYLDFYTVHYYKWGGTELSPFHHDYSHWNLSKPLVVAEFFLPDDTFGVSWDNLYAELYERGYAGALAWQWFDWANHRPKIDHYWPRALENMKTIRKQHPEDVKMEL